MKSNFCPGDIVVIRPGFKRRWNKHRQLDGLCHTANREFTVTQVFEPAASVEGTDLHRQWLAYDDGTSALGIANGHWFQPIQKRFRKPSERHSVAERKME